jgi:hypothetical protein
MSAFPTSDQDNPDKDNSRSLRGPRWITDRSAVESSMRRKTRAYSLWLGIAAGLVFSLSLWAYEAILFIGAHVAYPWIPLVVGTILCVTTCTLAALLTCLVNRALLGIVFWLVAARLIAEIAVILPLKIAPRLMIFFEPGLQSRLPAHPINATLQTWAGFGTIWLAIFFGILGLLQLTLVEQAVPAVTLAGRLTPYFVFIPIMVLASVMSGNMINEQLRAPLLATDDMIQFAVVNQNSTVDPDLARRMHLGAVNTFSDLINRPRRLFLGHYDEYFSQVDVLIDFDGKWVDCSTIIAQPGFCKPISNP